MKQPIPTLLASGLLCLAGLSLTLPQPAPAADLVKAILAESDLPPVHDQPLEGDLLGVTTHRLSNGMTVFISPNHDVPRFNAWVVVRSGSRHDPANSTGLAHYLEHMLFKGTSRMGTIDWEKEKPHLDRIAELYDQLRETDDPEERKQIFARIDEETQASAQYAIPNEMDQLVATMGFGGLNAFTWHDMTVYISDVPSNRLETWAVMEGERFSDPQYRLFYPELESVYEEKNMSLDRATRRVSYAVHEGLYPQHPYGTQTTIGHRDHLKTPAYADMHQYLVDYYVPNNMAIVLAGDVTAEQVLPLLEKHFARMQPRKLPELAPSDISAGPQGRQEVIIEAEGENSVTMAWRTVGASHDDMPAVTVMDMLVSNSSAGILDVDLVLSQKLVQAYSSPSFYCEGGHFLMYGQAKEGQTHEEVEALLMGVVDKLKRGEFTQEDIDAVVLNAEMQAMQSLESNQDRVERISEAFWNHMPWELAARSVERQRAVTREDVIRVANTYLDDDRVVIWRRQGEYSPPKMEKPVITPVPIDPSRVSEFAKEVQAVPVKPVEPVWVEEGTHYRRLDLSAGPGIHVENKINELFEVVYEFDLGRREEPLLGFALSLLERSGYGDTTPESLKQELWGLGSTINFSVGVDQTRITVSGIDRNLEPTLELLRTWLGQPRFTDDALAKLVENTISRRSDNVQEPAEVRRALSAYAARGASSRYLLTPSNADLQATDTGTLAGLVQALPGVNHRTLYFGPRPATEAAQKVALGDGGRDPQPIPAATYRPTRGETQIFFIHKDVTQTQMSMDFPQLGLSNDLRPVTELYNNYNGGMGGLLFQEIREARGLAYGVFGRFYWGDRPQDQPELFGYIGTQADKTMESLDVMLDLLRNMPEQPDRFQKALQEIDEGYRTSPVPPREVAGNVVQWERQGFQGDPRETWWKDAQELTPQDLADFSQRFSEGDLIIAVMGDRNRIDMDALAEYGSITEVDLETIFNY